MPATTEKPTSASGNIRLRFGQALPPVCVLCGRPSSTAVEMRFWEASEEQRLPIPRVLLPERFRTTCDELIHGRDQAEHKLSLPVCEAHAKWRRGRTLLVAAMLAIPAVMLMALAALGKPSPATTLTLCGMAMGLWMVVVWAYFRASGPVYARRVETIDIVLCGLAPEFVAAFHEKFRVETQQIDDFLDRLQP